MLPLLPLEQTAGVALGVTAIAGVSARGLAETYASPRGRLLLAGAFALPWIGLALWGAGPLVGSMAASYEGVRLAWGSLVVLLPIALSLPVAVLLRALARKRGGVAPADAAAAARPASTRALSRRALLSSGASALPLAAATVGPAALAAGAAPARIPEVVMRYPELHPDLDGLRILHLSDLHLGAALRAGDLEKLLVRAAAHAPDLLVMTGDVADDLDELRAALDLAARHAPRLGVFACLGNHEYLHDIGLTRPIYDASAVPLLVETNVAVTVGRARLVVAGANDPQVVGGDIAPFMEETVARSLAGAPSADFTLLLSHRPEGFEPAARRGVDLTLAGHTHGAQLGLGGRSLFERVFPEKRLWGTYTAGRHRLYTSSGAGHWFPIRLGCPTEAPIVILRRG